MAVKNHISFDPPEAVYRATICLYYLQTADEQSVAQTVHSNGVGFNSVDAGIMTSFSHQILRGKTLSDNQLSAARKILPKYTNQLIRHDWHLVALPDLKLPFEYIPKVDGGSGILIVEKERGGRKGLVFYPNVYPSQGIKSIGFTRWDKKTKGWHQSRPSVNLGAVKKVIKMFGDDVILDPSVEKLLHPKPIELPDWVNDPERLYDFQKETIRFQLQAKRCMVALAPRLGKTVTSIHAVQVAECKKVLVIAPLSLLFDWKSKIKKWSGEEATISYSQQLVLPSRWVITNYDTVRIHFKKFLSEMWDCIIIDESLLIKNRTTKRTKMVKFLVHETRPEYLWLLSGAPISRYYDDMWAQFNIIDPNRFTSYWRFVREYCLMESNEFSNYNIIGNKPDAHLELKDDLSDIYFHRSQEDVLDLPPWNIENIEIPMSKKQDEMYSQMENEFLAELGDDDFILAPNQLAQMVRLIQIASNPFLVDGPDEGTKWKAAIEMLSFEKLPCIIWTSFIKTAVNLQVLLKTNGYKSALLTGATPALERGEIVEKFQKGKYRVLIAHPAVGKYGLDLYTAKSVIYLERGYNGDDYYQSLNRVRHVDAKYAPHIIHLLSVRAGTQGGSTIDHVIDQVLSSKRDAVLKLTALDIRKLLLEEK